MFAFLCTLTLAAIAANGALAETHVISFVNDCGTGTPLLIQGGNTLSTGAPFTSDGPLLNAIAFLQTGVCGENGENCTLIETTLQNPTTQGSGSGSDISLIPPHSFSVASGFSYQNGCDGVGADCISADCTTAAHDPRDSFPQTVCLTNDVNLVITFCD